MANKIQYSDDCTQLLNCPTDATGTISIPTCVKELSDDAFADCTQITEVILPAHLTGIPRRAFKGCSSLKKITFSNEITFIGGQAFQGCSNLKEICLPDGVTIIGKEAFQDCISLEKVILPPQIDKMGPNAFAQCIKLKDINRQDIVDEFADCVFQDCPCLSNNNIDDTMNDSNLIETPASPKNSSPIIEEKYTLPEDFDPGECREFSFGIEIYTATLPNLEEVGLPLNILQRQFETKRLCYFQRLPEWTDSKNGIKKRYRIFIQLDNVVIRLDARPDWDSPTHFKFFIYAASIAPFLPDTEYRRALCQIEYGQFVKCAQEWADFLQEINQLSIAIDNTLVKKEKKIWDTYTQALSKVYTNKEKFWKIEKLGQQKVKEGKLQMTFDVIDDRPKLDCGLKGEDFIYITQNQYDLLMDLRRAKPLDYIAPDDPMFPKQPFLRTIQTPCKLGKLIQQDNPKRFIFELDEDFQYLLKEAEQSKEDMVTLKNGIIVPSFFLSLANIRRMQEAMRKILYPSIKNGFPANINLSKFIFDASYTGLPTESFDEAREEIKQNLFSRQLNERQLDAVTKALIAPDLAIIQGPPGTGKTTVITEIIWQTLRQNPNAKILLSSQTHVAVDNAIEKLRNKSNIHPLRLGNIDRIEPEGRFFSDERIQEWKYNESNSDCQDNVIYDAIKTAQRTNTLDSRDSELHNLWIDFLRLSQTKSNMISEYERHVNLFAGTCSECGSQRFARKFEDIFGNSGTTFDLVIIDECSKAIPPELAIPLTLGKRIVLIGDHKQLPPMIDENEFSEALQIGGEEALFKELRKEEYQTCLFEKIFLNAPDEVKASLDTQYRMHPQIMQCIQQFYNDQKELTHGLQAGVKDVDREHNLFAPPLIRQEDHAIWVNIQTPEERVTPSIKNEGEVNAVKKILEILNKAIGLPQFVQETKATQIGVITYYRAQVDAISNAIKDIAVGGMSVDVKSVDKFQGMEREIIVMSTVRSCLKKNGRNTSLGFARDTKRINVGMSRAKRLLIVVGDRNLFERDNNYKQVIKNMKVIDWNQIKNL